MQMVRIKLGDECIDRGLFARFDRGVKLGGADVLLGLFTM